MRLPLQFQPNRRNNAQCRQYIRGRRQHHFRVRTKRLAAPGAAQCIRYRKFGGGWRGFTMAKPSRPNQRVLYMHSNYVLSKAVCAFYFSWLNNNPTPSRGNKRKFYSYPVIFFAPRNYSGRFFWRIGPVISALLSIARQAGYKDRHCRPCRHRKKQPLKSVHSTAASSTMPLAPRGRFHA